MIDLAKSYKQWKKTQRRALAEAREGADIDRYIDLFFRVHWGKSNPAIEESFQWYRSAISEIEEARVRLERKEYFPSQRRNLELIASTRP